MDKKTKIFYAVFFLLIVGSVGLTYYRIMVKKDYIVESQIDCDPYAEACFIWKCDPESDVEGEACKEDPEENIWYYKLARRNAGMVPLCDPNTDESCDPWTCQAGEADCEQILCDETNKAEFDAECNDPEEYLLNNPPEEETPGCDEESEECLIDSEGEMAEPVECEEGDAACASGTAESSEGGECGAEDGACLLIESEPQPIPEEVPSPGPTETLN